MVAVMDGDVSSKRGLRRLLLEVVVIGGFATAVATGLGQLAVSGLTEAVKSLRAEVQELAVAVRGINASATCKTANGSERQTFDPAYDQIVIPSPACPDRPSLTIPAGKRAIIMITANAKTSFVPPGGREQGIGFRLSIKINGQECFSAADQATLAGNAPVLAGLCVQELEGGKSHRVEIIREPHGSGYINRPDEIFFRAQYTLWLFDGTRG